MKTKKIIIFITTILVVGYSLCNPLLVKAVYSVCKSYISKPDIEFVKSNNWVHEKGFRITRDFILFSKRPQSYCIKGDTIFYDKEPRAKIIRTNKYLEALEVEAFSNDSIGIYYRRRW